MAPFSVGVTNGAAMKRPDLSNAIKMGLFFGGAHALLLLVGWIIGVGMRDYISVWDHWVVFGLLGFLGGEMIVESFNGADEGQAEASVFDTYGQRGSGKTSPRRGRRHCYGYARRLAQVSEAAVLADESRPFETQTLMLLSIALSLDALAIGLSFSIIDVSIGVPTLIIGVVVFAFTLLGFPVGSHSGEFIKDRIGILGGLVLIAIGLKVLLEHIG